MLKLCVFLKRAKLTFMELLSTGILIVNKLCVDFFKARHLCALNVRPWIRRRSNALSVNGESVFKPRSEYINCLHPGALNAHVWNHISDAPRLPFAFMSHFK